MKVLRNTLMLLFTGMTLLGLQACESWGDPGDGPVERTGAEVDEGVEATGEAIESGGEAVQEGFEG